MRGRVAMGCGQSKAMHVCQGTTIYEMTFDMTSTSSPPLTTSLNQGLGLDQSSGELQHMIECLPGVTAGENDVLRMPGRLVRVAPLPQRSLLGS